MKFIANILTPKSFPNNEMFNIVNDKSQIIEGLPTLVIGWKFAQELYPTANILEWKIDNNTYWTFGNREKRDRYEKCVVNFKNLAISNYIKQIKYRFFNILTSNNDDKKNFSIFLKEMPLIAYSVGNMIYFYNISDNTVTGICISDFSYGNYNIKKLFATMYENKNIKVIGKNEDIPWDIKIILKNNMYVIPSLFS